MLSVPAQAGVLGLASSVLVPVKGVGMRSSDLLLLWDCLLLPALHLCAPCQLRSGSLSLLLLFMQLKSQILAPNPPVVNPNLVRLRGTSTLLTWGTVAWGDDSSEPCCSSHMATRAGSEHSGRKM